MVKVELSHTLTGDGLGGGNNVYKLGEAVGEGDESVEATGGEGEAGDEVERDGLPRLVGDGEGVQEAVRVVGGSELACLARGAIGQVGADGVVEAWPIEVACEAGDGLGDAKMTGDGDVMGFLEEGGA